jgi:hypothetical protein
MGVYIYIFWIFSVEMFKEFQKIGFQMESKYFRIILYSFHNFSVKIVEIVSKDWISNRVQIF